MTDDLRLAKWYFKWKFTILMGLITLLAVAVTCTMWIIGWRHLGFKTGLWVWLLVFGWQSFTLQTNAIVKGIIEFRRALR